MRHLGMVGTTFRRAGQADLQRYTFEDPLTSLAHLHAACGFEESVYIATCNRVEVVFVAPPGISVAECRLRLYRYFHPTCDAAGDGREQMRRAARAFHAYDGEGAAEHLFAVAASVDSMTPGEAQILGQVKGAYRDATELGLAGARLAPLFEEAFAAAKRVRHGTRIGNGAVSMVSLAVEAMDARLQRGAGRLVVIGAGEMAEQAGATFASREGVSLTFVNRTVERADDLAKRYGGASRSLADFLAAPGAMDVLLTATAAPAPFLDAGFFARLAGAAPLVVDLSVHRDVIPEDARGAGATLCDLDELKAIAARHRQEREAELAAARLVLDEALEAFRRRLVEREMAPVVRVLRDMYQTSMDREMGELFSRVLTACSEEDRERLQRWSRGVVNRLAHVPTVGLKRLAFEHGPGAVDTFLEGVRGDSREHGPAKSKGNTP